MPYRITQTRLFLQDEAINLDDLTELEDGTVFSLEEQTIRSYEKDLQTQMDITIEMNLSETVVARDGYTFLDYLSDIGGMQGLLISGVAYFLAFWNYKYFSNYMVGRLFKLKIKTHDRMENLSQSQ